MNLQSFPTLAFQRHIFARTMTKISRVSGETLFIYLKKHYSCVSDLTASNLMKYIYLSHSFLVVCGSHKHQACITGVAINMSKQGEVSCQSLWLMTDMLLNACYPNRVVSRSCGSYQWQTTADAKWKYFETQAYRHIHSSQTHIGLTLHIHINLDRVLQIGRTF